MFEIWHVMNKCTVVAKRELFYAWPFGLAAWLAGLTFIDRVRGEKARSTLNAVNSRVKKEKIKLWVFPEGTRRNTGELHPFKKGAFHMAIEEQIPILPVVFSSYCSFLNDKMKILNAGNVIITAMPPISTTNLIKDDLPELMDKIHRQMTLTLKQTSAEVLARYKPVKKTQSTMPIAIPSNGNPAFRNSQASATRTVSLHAHLPNAAGVVEVMTATKQDIEERNLTLATNEHKRNVMPVVPTLNVTNA